MTAPERTLTSAVRLAIRRLDRIDGDCDTTDNLHHALREATAQRRAEREGWKVYQEGGKRFVEDMNKIGPLAGSNCYEWMQIGRVYYVRRVD